MTSAHHGSDQIRAFYDKRALTKWSQVLTYKVRGKLYHGSYRQGYVKFKVFSRTSKKHIVQFSRTISL